MIWATLGYSWLTPESAQASLSAVLGGKGNHTWFQRLNPRLTAGKARTLIHVLFISLQYSSFLFFFGLIFEIKCDKEIFFVINYYCPSVFLIIAILGCGGVVVVGLPSSGQGSEGHSLLGTQPAVWA